MKYIVDISEHNNITNWPQFAKEVEAAIIHLGYRGSIEGKLAYKKITMDDKFLLHLSKVKQYGIRYGIYYFPTPINDEEAVEEAVWVRDQIQGLDLSFPVFLDSENVKSDRSGRADKLSKADRTHLLRVISDHLLSWGIPCGVYSYTSWLRDNVNLSQLDARVIRNTWVAQNPVLTYGGTVAMWQYGTKQFSWASGPIDVNKMVDGFDMEVDDMAYYRSVIVDKARSFLGTKDNSPKHKEILAAYNSQKSLPRGYKMTVNDAWCATFVSAIAIMCNYTAIIPTECSCGYMVDKAKKMGIWQEKDDYVPKPGDILMYDWDDNKTGAGDDTGWPDHTGYVETVNGTTSFTTIEGNAGGGEVKRQTVQVNQKNIRGFITPKYTAAVVPGTVVPNPNKRISLTINLPELRKGDKGPAVGLWQYLVGAKQDNDFGQKTEGATKTWQKANGKTVDGWVGKGSWTKMFQNKGWM